MSIGMRVFILAAVIANILVINIGKDMVRADMLTKVRGDCEKNLTFEIDDITYICQRYVPEINLRK